MKMKSGQKAENPCLETFYVSRPGVSKRRIPRRRLQAQPHPRPLVLRSQGMELESMQKWVGHPWHLRREVPEGRRDVGCVPCSIIYRKSVYRGVPQGVSFTCSTSALAFYLEGYPGPITKNARPASSHSTAGTVRVPKREGPRSFHERKDVVEEDLERGAQILPSPMFTKCGGGRRTSNLDSGW